MTQGRPSPETIEVLERLADDLPPIEAVAALADHYDQVTLRALKEAERELGPSPVPYCWLTLGSHARREPSLASDQDNALVLAEATPAALEHGTAMAARVVDALDAAGLRRCDGDYMATVWCHSLADWQEKLRRRFVDPSPADIVDADVFLDLRPLAGDLDVSVLSETMVSAAGSARLLRGLARAAVQYPSGLTAMGRLRLTKGAVDIKRGGLAPLTMIARTYALAAGSTSVDTRDRLAAAQQANQLSARAAGRLGFAHALLTRLRLRHQLRCAHSGEPITDLVPVSSIRRVDSKLLRDALEAIREVQQATALRFRTDLEG